MGAESDAKLRRSAKGIIQRVDALEQQYINLVNGVNGILMQHGQQSGQLAERLEAVCKVLGEEKVLAEITSAREAKAVAAMKAAKDALDAAVEAGIARPEESVGEKSLLCGNQFNPEGQPLVPPRFQITYAALDDATKKQALGKKAGDKVMTPSGNVWEITEVYFIDEERQRQLQAEEQARLAEEARLAAELDELADKGDQPDEEQAATEESEKA